MADKKITVLGDAAEEPLTPEEEHKIEVKIDKMLAPEPSENPGQPEEQVEASEKPTPEPKIEKKNKKILPVDDGEELPVAVVPKVHVAAPVDPIDNEPVSEETAAKTAPPLPKKTGKKVTITIKNHDDPQPEETALSGDDELPEASEPAVGDEPQAEELPEELVPEKLPKKPLKISIDEPEPVVAIPTPPTDAEEAEVGGEPTAEEPTPEAETESEPSDNQEEEAEETDPLAEPIGEVAGKPLTKKSAESKSTEPKESETKKYRPPDGPLPFKRADTAPSKEEVLPDLSLDASAEEDAALTKAFEPTPTKKKRSHLTLPHPRPRGGRTVRKAVIILFLAVVAALIAIPNVRTAALNLVHVHGTATIVVIDSTNHGPLSNATVQLGDQQATTNASGRADFKDLRLGSQTIQVQKSAFDPVSRPVFISLGTNELGNVSLRAQGTQYSFVVNDYVSGLPISGATAKVGTSESRSGSKGQLSLVAAPGVSKTVTVSAKGYKSAQTSLPATSSTVTTVTLAPAQEDLYVGRGSGKFNVYAVGVDGKDAQLLLAGSGSETSSMDLIPNDDGSLAALVSTRDNIRDKAGYLLETLTLLKAQTASTGTTITHGQQIKVVGWFGNRLVYTVLKADVSSSDPARYQLFSFDTTSGKATELDHASNLNDVVAADGVIYYATSNHSSSGSSQLLKIAPDGKGKQTLLESEVTSILRTSHNDLVLATAGKWYSLKLGSTKPTVTNTTASSSRLYVDSQDGSHSAWVDQQSGKLYLYTKSSGAEAVLVQQSGLVYPIRWLNDNTLVYRISTPAGVGDYVVGIQPGTPKKITSAVLDLNGLTLWHD